MSNQHDQKTDRYYMEMAIKAARKCVSERGKTSPFVGAVAVANERFLEVAYRSELNEGDHAEFTLLEKKLKDSPDVAGATIYATLEPCTQRGNDKVPCASRLAERKVSRVVIGMLDPNPQIRGEGILRLRQANIVVDFFDHDLMAQLEDLNREFTRAHRSTNASDVVDPEFVENNKDRSLDDWYHKTNSIYWNKNFDRDRMSIFAHLVETIGTLRLLASAKKKSGVLPESYVQKSFAWWLALCGKLGVKSVSSLIWDKFPGVCSYCHQSPHDPDECTEKKAANLGPQ